MRHAALVTGGVVGLAILALLAPVALGLMSAFVLHTLRVSGGKVPVVLLAAIHGLDLVLIGGVAGALWWTWRRRAELRPRLVRGRWGRV
ncbi:MAG TPA: hypothetical protein VGI06_07760 [Acidimicrobiales bacterium]